MSKKNGISIGVPNEFIQNSWRFSRFIIKENHPDPTHVLQPEDIEIDESLTYEEQRRTLGLKNERIEKQTNSPD